MKALTIIHTLVQTPSINPLTAISKDPKMIQEDHLERITMDQVMKDLKITHTVVQITSTTHLLSKSKHPLCSPPPSMDLQDPTHSMALPTVNTVQDPIPTVCTPPSTS
jgi:hypothetical protein